MIINNKTNVINVAGNLISVNVSSGDMYDSSGFTSINWESRILTNSSFATLIDWAGSQPLIYYIPGNSSHWNGDPLTISDAIDRLAAEIYNLNSNTPIP